MTSRRSIALCSSLLLSFAVALGACGSSSPGTGSLGGSNGSLGGTTGAHGGATGAAGGSTGSNGGTTGAAGGMSGAPGGTSGGGGATVNCGDIPPCLANLLTNCIPTGTCVSSGPLNTTTGFSDATCYSNGVKISEIITQDPTTSAGMGSITYSKGGATCLSEQFPIKGEGGAGGASPTVATIKNGSGTTVATLTVTDSKTTVTCGGMTYDVTDKGDCSMPSMGTSSASDCTDDVAGTCTP